VSGLLARGAHADAVALRLAAARGHTSCCDALLPVVLPAGAAPPSEPWLAQALKLSAARGHEEVLRTLCAHPPARAALPACGGAAVRAACALRGADKPATGADSGLRERLIACLCEAGAPADYVEPGGDGTTGLHLAAAAGLAVTSKLLLAAGADASRASAAGLTAADVAQRAGHDELAALLVRERVPRKATALPPLAGLAGLPTASPAAPLPAVVAPANGAYAHSLKPLEPLARPITLKALEPGTAAAG
jgi:ankyrin repeat protein